MKYFATFAALMSTTDAAAASYLDNGDSWIGNADYENNECSDANQSPIDIITADWPTVDAADDELTKTYTNYKYDNAAGSFMWPVSVLTGDGVGADIGEGGGVTYNLQNLADYTF